MLSCFLIRSTEQPMAALVLVLLVTMAVYAWFASPLIIGGTVVLKALWLAWLPLLMLGWLLAGQDDS